MIRNVVVHISNEQPLLTDIFDVPVATDAGLLCTNLRTIDGKRPVFIDRVDNTFFFPYLVIRFLEIPVGALERHRDEGGASDAPARAGAGPSVGAPGERLPAVIEVPAGEDLDDGAGEEIDEDFLQRIRDI